MLKSILLLITIAVAQGADAASAPKRADDRERFREMRAQSATLRTEAKATEQRAVEIERTFYSHWLTTANIASLSVPTLPADPRQSDRDAKAAAERVNEFLHNCIGWRQAVKDGQLAAGSMVALERFFNSADLDVYLAARK